MRSIAKAEALGQLTLSFEPSLPEQYDTVVEYVNHLQHHQLVPQKTLAGKMDLAPSTLSRKLSPKDGDTQRFNCDDLEAFIRVTGDTSPIEYLIAKYMQGPNAKKHRIKKRVVNLMDQLERLLPELEDDE